MYRNLVKLFIYFWILASENFKKNSIFAWLIFCVAFKPYILSKNTAATDHATEPS
jgi:hypothetical protein